MATDTCRDLPVQDIGRGDHVCLAFADDAEQRHVLSQYLADGLRQGERVLYFADRNAPDEVLGWLAAVGIDPGPLISRGQLAVTTADDSYLASGTFDPDAMVAVLRQEVDASLAAGYTGFRVSGEMGWALREVPGADRLAEYETKVNAVFAEGRSSAVCQYDARLFGPDELHGFDRCHPSAAELRSLYQDARLRLVPAFRSGHHALRVIGTVDHQGTATLAAALETLLGRPGDLYVDMGELEFIDLAGVRALAHAADRMAAGRRLHVVNLAPLMAQVVRLVGFDEIPALSVDTAEATA
ncbi:MEDS domain-containing protein [Streptomyces longwoodensis]|uniref:MEDS domain-containing protein n=1 Tax=Streptomyces longwoodensis TaxID=68231 RepID=UPI0033EED4DE